MESRGFAHKLSVRMLRTGFVRNKAKRKLWASLESSGLNSGSQNSRIQQPLVPGLSLHPQDTEGSLEFPTPTEGNEPLPPECASDPLDPMLDRVKLFLLAGKASFPQPGEFWPMLQSSTQKPFLTDSPTITWGLYLSSLLTFDSVSYPSYLCECSLIYKMQRLKYLSSHRALHSEPGPQSLSFP